MPALSLRNLTTVGSLLLSPLIGHNPGLTLPGGTPPVLKLIDFSTLPDTPSRPPVAEPHPSGLLSQNQSEEHNLDDDRMPVNDTDSFPFSAIGVVLVGGNYLCTGSLVGPRHVATAAHCYSDDGMLFVPGFKNGSVDHDVFKVTTVLGSPQGLSGKFDYCQDGRDFIILVLGECIGDRLGFFEVGVVNQDLSPEMEIAARFRSAGYPGDLARGGVPTMYWQKDIKILDVGTCSSSREQASRLDRARCQYIKSLGYQGNDCEYLLTDADSGDGQSGAPLWLEMANGARRVYGVISSSEASSPQTDNGTEFGSLTSVANARFANAVEQAKLDYP